MEQILEFINPVMAALIVALAEGIKAVFKNLPGQIASIISAIVVAGVWFLFDDGLSIVEGIISFLSAVAAYDFVVKPLSRPKKPVGGIGGPPIP